MKNIYTWLSPYLLPSFIFFGLILQGYSAFCQPPNPAFRPPSQPGSKLNFEVQETSLPLKDSITHLYQDPVSESIIRLFSTPASVLKSKKGDTESVLQRGIILENDTRISFPPGEYFFAYYNNKLYTETFHRNIGSRQLTSTQKGYLLNQKRLIPIGSVRDTLNGEKSPSWYLNNGAYIVGPGAMLAARDSSLFVSAEKGKTPNTFLVSFFEIASTTPNKSIELVLGQKNKRLTSFGLRKILVIPDYIVFFSAFRTGNEGPIKYLVSTCDRKGELLWEKEAGDKIMTQAHRYDEVFWIEDNPLIHQNLVCTSAESGRTKWEASLYELYNNDPRFEFTVINPDEFKVLAFRSVMEGNYIAAVIGQQKSDSLLYSQCTLYLLDRLGKKVYQYEIPTKISHIGIKDLGYTLGLVSETKKFKFRPK